MVSALSILAACTEIKTPGSVTDIQVQQPQVETKSKIGLDLSDLPPPKRKVDIAVYAYADKTGQQKPADNISRFSKAVTQGADAILVDVLKDTGEGGWFNVVERSGLNNLLNERNIIDKSRQSYQGAKRSSLPPLRFAGIILEGGIINYDSNVITSGAGARYLSIGPSVRYRRDVLTVALRTVSVSTGEVLNSVTTTKTIYSTLLQGSVFKFVAIDELLEIDAGFSRNEPVGLAVRQAIELAVYSLVLDGTKKGLWSFRDRGVEQELLDHYEGRVPLRVAGFVPPVSAPKSKPKFRSEAFRPEARAHEAQSRPGTQNSAAPKGKLDDETVASTGSVLPGSGTPVVAARENEAKEPDSNADATAATKPAFRPTASAEVRPASRPTIGSSSGKQENNEQEAGESSNELNADPSRQETLLAAYDRWKSKQKAQRVEAR